MTTKKNAISPWTADSGIPACPGRTNKNELIKSWLPQNRWRNEAPWTHNGPPRFLRAIRALHVYAYAYAFARKMQFFRPPGNAYSPIRRSQAEQFWTSGHHHRLLGNFTPKGGGGGGGGGGGEWSPPVVCFPRGFVREFVAYFVDSGDSRCYAPVYPHNVQFVGHCFDDGLRTTTECLFEFQTEESPAWDLLPPRGEISQRRFFFLFLRFFPWKRQSVIRWKLHVVKILVRVVKSMQNSGRANLVNSVSLLNLCQRCWKFSYRENERIRDERTYRDVKFRSKIEKHTRWRN